MIENKLLARLKSAQQEYGIQALKQPDRRDAFEYGYRVGMMAGYESAIGVLLDLLNEEKHGERDL